MATIPKRAEESRRHDTDAEKADRQARKSAAGESVTIPEADPNWHPMVLDFYTNLPKSGQSKFYEQSDWDLAKITCEMLDRALKPENLNARALAEVNKLLGNLMVTEGHRRKLHLELQRPVGGYSSLEGDDTPALASIADYYKDKLTG